MANELEEYLLNEEGYPNDADALAELKEAIKNNEPDSEKLRELFDRAYGEPVNASEKQFRAGFDELLANRPEAKNESAPTSGVTQELPSLDQARQNFRATVQAFVDEYEKRDPEIKNRKDPKDSSVELYGKLTAFLKNESLPKHNQESDIVDAMAVLKAQLAARLRSEGNDQTFIRDMTGPLQSHIDAARKAADDYNAVYAKDQQQAANPQPPTNVQSPTDTEGFVEGNKSLYQYNDGKNYTVMSTQNTKEGFKNALDHFANSKDASGQARKWTNVNLVHPPVSTEKLMGNVKYKNNVFDQIMKTMDAGLYPANDIRKMVEALSGPSLNSRARWGWEKEHKAQQLKQLTQRVDRFKAERDAAKAGKTLEGPSMQASVTRANKATQERRATQDTSKSNSATISMRPAK